MFNIHGVPWTISYKQLVRMEDFVTLKFVLLWCNYFDHVVVLAPMLWAFCCPTMTKNE